MVTGEDRLAHDVPWLIGVALIGDDMTVVRVADHGADLASDLTFRITVRIAIETSRENGLPDNAEADRLKRIEDDITASTAGRTVFIASSTVPTRRIYTLYTNDEAWVEQWGWSLRSRHMDRTIDFWLREEGDHGAYRILIEEARIADATRRAIDQLRAAGADIQVPRSIEYFMYFPSEQAASDTAEELRSHSFTVTIFPPKPPAQWCVLASREERPLPAIIARATAMLRYVAQQHGGDFDGWGAPASS